MTFDTYSNCSFKCIYCFSQYQRGIGNASKQYYSNIANSVNIKKVKDIFLNPDKYDFAEYIKNRKVVQWGGLSDQFDMNEKEQGVTLELLKFFKEIDYPLCFSTKSVWWLYDKRYTDLFRGQKNWNCKFSIITLDKYKSSIIEKLVPSPQARLKAIEEYSKLDAGGQLCDLDLLSLVLVQMII